MVPIVIKGAFTSKRASPRRAAAPWAAGYLPNSQMTVSGSAFVQPVRLFFGCLYAIRIDAPWAAVVRGFAAVVTLARRAEPGWDRGIVNPIARGVQVIGQRMQALQGGNLRTYCVYIVGALVLLLTLAAR